MKSQNNVVHPPLLQQQSCVSRFSLSSSRFLLQRTQQRAPNRIQLTSKPIALSVATSAAKIFLAVDACSATGMAMVANAIETPNSINLSRRVIGGRFRSCQGS